MPEKDGFEASIDILKTQEDIRNIMKEYKDFLV